MTIDLSNSVRVHVIGIGGSGMAAIAEVLHGMGHKVSGTDLYSSKALDDLIDLGIEARVGHVGEATHGADFVVRSTAIPDHNVEVFATRERGARVYRRADILAAIAAQRPTVAVAGTHGKTTTSSMLAVAARAAGLDPSYIIGGTTTDLGTGAHWGSGHWFVVEADESDGTFLELGHRIGVVTNVEPDHLEHYGGEAALRQAFVDFAAMGSRAIICADDQGARALLAADADGAQVVTYGVAQDADVRMVDVQRSARGTTFRLETKNDLNGVVFGDVAVSMPGLHNARNAVAALVAVQEMGGDLSAAKRALSQFGGVGRRFDARGSVADIEFIDDYAHLPTEVRAALDAATDLHRQRVVAVFQPHRYSRTEQLWEQFEGAFDDADLLVVTGIYSSGETPRPGITGELIVEAIQRRAGHPEVVYVEERAAVATQLQQLLQPGDLCITLGAGDLTLLPDELISLLSNETQA